jgi:hypothetical protein
MAKTIIITWKEARHHTIGAAPGGKNAKGEEVAGHGKVRLMPGANTVNFDDWQAVKKLPLIKLYLDKELIVEGDTLDGEVKTLAELKPAAAVKLVGETLDKKRLEGWLEVEDRAPVRKAIETRIAVIDSQRSDKKSE